jgi:uncharacterized protein DUF6893
MGKIVVIGLLLAVGGAVAVQLPELQRYLKIRKM